MPVLLLSDSSAWFHAFLAGITRETAYREGAVFFRRQKQHNSCTLSHNTRQKLNANTFHSVNQMILKGMSRFSNAW
jgi:hypothetical protein